MRGVRAVRSACLVKKRKIKNSLRTHLFIGFVVFSAESIFFVLPDGLNFLPNKAKRGILNHMENQNENQYEKALRIMQSVPADTKLLLHSCCAPCSSSCLELLHKYFCVTVFYYNPNINDEGEYLKRKSEQIRFLKETGWANILDCDHDAAAFQNIATGLETCPERGERCYKCYEIRLKKTAFAAKENGFDYFTTTLSVSPYKVSRWINEIGYALEKEIGVKFLPSDFKKRGGYLRSVQLSETYGLYRQNFCGCRFSQKERELKALSEKKVPEIR